MSTSTSKTQKKALFAGNTSRATAGMTKSRKSGPAGSTISKSRAPGQSMFGGASRTILSSASRRNVQVGGSEKAKTEGKPPVQVYDDEGADVTPLPLLQLDPNVVRQKQSNLLADSSAGTPTDLMSQASLYQTGTVTASTFGGPFTRSVFSQSQSEQTNASMGEADMEQQENLGSTAEITRVIREEPKEELTEHDLEKVHDITLTETDTIWILDIPGVCVSLESEEAEEIKEQNERYAELTKDKIGNDRYMDRGMNTFNNPPKIKAVQTTKISHADAGISASTWDMYDTHKMIEEQEAKAIEEMGVTVAEDGSMSRPISAVDIAAEKKDSQKEAGVGVGVGTTQTDSVDKDNTTMSKALESMNTMSSVVGSDAFMKNKKQGIVAVTEESQEEKENLILQSDEFRAGIVSMERALNLNNYQPKQALYRGLDIVTDIDKIKPEDEEPDSKKAKKKALDAVMPAHEIGPNVDRLWAYQCPLTKGRNVSCIVWNKQNPDLLAVGYGQFDYNKQKGGLVCCWSLKNPEYPERIYTTSSGVTAMDFSAAHANLLAVGLHNGTVAIFNVRSRKNEAILDSFESSGKHTGPVWELKWIEKERGSGEERAEVLVSVSTDGRVTQWSIRKGFESYDLMKLKRVANKTVQGKVKKPEALISKHAGGLCFDFNAKDSNIYLTGTEEGHIHRCSCSYNEQYLDSYHGHTGPVYKIAWSPFNPEVFLSCSGDWTVRLWHQDRTSPVLTFHSSTKCVPDMSWSPRSSTVFACVNEGAVEVWDLSLSVLDPIVINPAMAGIKFSSVQFAQNSECILVGDSEGGVTVFQLRSMPDPPKAKVQGETLHKVMQASIASQLKA